MYVVIKSILVLLYVHVLGYCIYISVL